MEKILVYSDDNFSLFKIVEAVSKEDKHFSTITYQPTSDYLNVLTKTDDNVIVEYFYKESKQEDPLPIYNCKKVSLKPPQYFIPYNHSNGYKEYVYIDGCLEEEIKSL